MTAHDIIRAWKDKDYRGSLSKEQRALLPAHPAAMVDLGEEELQAVNGGTPMLPLSLTCFIVCIWLED